MDSTSSWREKPRVLERVHPGVLNMSTGPVHVSEAVLRSQDDPSVLAHAPCFWPLYDETIAMVRKVLHTKVDTLIVHGSIRIGLDIALSNLVRPGMKVLALSNGFWGDYIAENARAHGAAVIEISGPLLSPLNPQTVRDALEEHSGIQLVLAVHVETNTGIVNPVAEIAAIVAKTSAAFLVDTACSAGAMPIDTDDWSIDISVTGTHKTLAALPGLTVLTVSEKAWRMLARHERGGAPVHLHLRSLFDANFKRGSPPGYTQPVSLIHALHAALREIEEIGLENWFGTHIEAAALLRSSLRDAGFRLVLDDEANSSRDCAYSAPSVIAVSNPKGLDDQAFRKLLLDEYGLFVIGNVGSLAGCSFRIGLMSSVQMEQRNILATVSALAEAAHRLGVNLGKR